MLRGFKLSTVGKDSKGEWMSTIRIKGLGGLLVGLIAVGLVVWVIVSVLKLLILLLPLVLLLLGGYLVFRYLRQKLA